MSNPTPQDNFSVVIPIVAGVGNALMLAPMVRQLKRNRPGARVAVVARSTAMAEPFRRLTEVDEVFITGDGASGLMRGVAWMRRRRADVFLVPFPSNRWQYNLLAWASGAHRVVIHGYPIGRWRTLAFLNPERLPAQRGLHDVVQNVRLLRLLGIEPDETERPVFVLRDVDRWRSAKLLLDAGLRDDAGFVAVHAGSAQTVLAQAKRWPPQRYAELIHALHKQLRCAVVLLEGPDETGVAHEITEHLRGEGGVHVLRLNGPLGDAAAVLERARLYVGSDSGLAHLAAAVGTPPVTLFAPADPDRVSPFGYRDLVVQPDRPCSPCLLYPWKATRPKIRCRPPMCIEQITVQQVMSAVRQAMNKATATARAGV